MKKIFILFIMVMVSVACGTKSVELGNPNFPDNEAVSDADTDTDMDADTENDSDVDLLSDDDSIINTDDDSILPDNDSVIDADDDTVINPDDDSVVIPDDDAVAECTIGEQKCDDTLDNVVECNVAHAWVSVEDCSDPLKMCVENPVGTFYCDTLTCEPGVKFCKNEDVYTCNADGKTDVLSTNCTDLQYCDTTTAPVSCQDMICDPDQLFCDGNVLSLCNSNGGGSTASKDCGAGVCNETLKDCVYTGEVGGASSFDRTGQRGNFFDCTENVAVVEFSQQLEFSGNKDLSWAIYEDSNGDNTYEKIFTKTLSVTGTGKSYYSTGAISVNLINGRKYVFITAWSGTVTVYYGSNPAGNDPIAIGFGSTHNGHSINSNTFPDSLINPAKYEVVFNQQIKFVVE